MQSWAERFYLWWVCIMIQMKMLPKHQMVIIRWETSISSQWQRKKTISTNGFLKSTQVSCKTAPVEYYTVSILGCFSFTFLFTAKLPLLNTAGQLIFGFFYIHKNSESGFILRPLLSRTGPIQPVSALLAKMPGWYQRWEINGQTASSWQNNSNSSIQL